ncbi:hypothetical protein D8674_024786 [Pyrus ussuriensis x Pyrus communis]|uniref:Uncharacterized protein n=1 Tax=Pyrus ussuriensis x Pyrus communis TaxID=2448454 RepID=A0A5N5HHD6_9ROSA|nr:hypothetical protein D8674_024786 [Pyrus ussuriensis x Pyrus communis]
MPSSLSVTRAKSDRQPSPVLAGLEVTSFKAKTANILVYCQLYLDNRCNKGLQVRPHIPHLCPTCLIQNPYDHGTMGMALPYKVASAKSPGPKVDECLTCWS